MPISKKGNHWLQWSICSNRLKWFHTQIANQLIWLIFATLEVKTILIDGADAQFQKIYNLYEIILHICVDFFLGHAVDELQNFWVKITFWPNDINIAGRKLINMYESYGHTKDKL